GDPRTRPSVARPPPRASGPGPTRLEGPPSPAGVLPLLKFCEDSRLTGRLVVQSHGAERWADFRGGDLVQAGGSAEVPGEDPLGALLATEAGTYRIEQRPLDADALLALEARAGASGGAAAMTGT